MSEVEDSFLDSLKCLVAERELYEPVYFGAEPTLQIALSVISSGRALLTPYHHVYGILVDPFATLPEDIKINTNGTAWPDLLLKLLKADLDSVKSVEDLLYQLQVRQMPPVQVNTADLIPFFDFSKIPTHLHKLFNDPEQLYIFSSLAFLRTPMLSSVLSEGLLPEYLFSGLDSGTPVLQWIDFTKHPEAGILQSHLLTNFIQVQYPNKIPALALTSANISKITPESVDPETAYNFWTQGNNLRRLLMPLLIHNSSELHNRAVAGAYHKRGSYPIFEIGKQGLVGWREGNIPLQIQRILFAELGLNHPPDIKMHNYTHSDLNGEPLDFLSSDITLRQKTDYLHYLSLGYHPDIAKDCALRNLNPDQIVAYALA